MKVLILRRFGFYGPDLLLLGLVIALGMAIASATGVVTAWMSVYAIGAAVVVRGAALFHDQVRGAVRSIGGVVAKWGLSLLRRFPRLTSALTVVAGLVALVGLVAVFAIGWRAFSGTGTYVAFGGSLALAAAGLAGQALWFVWQRREWERLNS